MDDAHFLSSAIEAAERSVAKGGFPAGAVIVKDGKILSEGIALGFSLHDPTSHPEIAAIREACQKLGTVDLSGATLYESLECCVMCFSAAYWAGVSKIVYAAKKTEDMISKGYYEGRTSNNTINNENNRQIELVFDKTYEQDAMNIVRMWEEKGGFNQK